LAAAETERRGRGGLGRIVADPVVLIVLYCLVVSAVFLVWPSIDLSVSGAFYDRLDGFAASDDPGLGLLRSSGSWAMVAVIAVCLLSVIARIALPSRRSFVPPSVSLFLLSSLAVATGILVNLVLKDHWGRPRPRSVVDFGGDLPYVEVWHITRYCARNCSFVAGEASSALWLTALALVVPRPWRWPVLIVTGIYAVALSLNRIAFGGHFLSDVLLSWGITALVIAVLYRLVIVQPPAWLSNVRLEAGLAGLGTALLRQFRR
jgi:membrane-associated phospholipid phosphatase